MGAALAENKTPVQYSLCLWGVDDVSRVTYPEHLCY